MQAMDLIKVLCRVKQDVLVSIESPMAAGKAYPVDGVSVAEHKDGLMVMLTSTETADAPCHRCLEAKSLGRNTYTVSYTLDDKPRTTLFDVDAAYKIAKDGGLVPTEIPENIAKDLVFVNLSETFCGRHSFHVDHSIPAIVGTYCDKFTLLDGTHRIVARMGQKLKPIAYLLSEEETQRCVIAESL